MSATVQALNVFLPVAYLVAAALYAMAFGGPNAPVVERPRRMAFLIALILHVAYFAAIAFGSAEVPDLGTWSALSAIALSTAVMYALIARTTRQANTGGAILGAVFLMQLLASAFVSSPSGHFNFGLISVMHVVTSLLATSAVILSGIHGALYLLLYRQMRRRTFGVLFKRLPDLQELARLTRRSALAGFLLLGVGLNLGIAWAHAVGMSGFSYTDPYVLVVLGLWIHLGLVAFSSKISGFSAWRTAFASTVFFLILVLAFVLTLARFTFHLQA